MVYHCKFPNPPKFKNSANKENFEVPKYYGFDHPCTKWILGSIVSNQALFRILKVATNYQCILKRYHQIPDSPRLIMKDQYNVERAAFDSQAILYLTPLAISIYMKYEDALTQLVGLKDSNGATIIDPNDLCFVQNFWRKGDTRYFTDLIATFPAIIAIRRNYFIAFKYLLMAGYCPNDSFSVTYRKPHREIIICYRDLIDYVIDYLKRRPAFNVGKLMNVLLQPIVGSTNNLDIFCFDYYSGITPNFVSIFQRITRTVLEEENISEENGMHIINILEKIQEAGFFLGLRNSAQNSNALTHNLDDLIKNINGNKLKMADLQKLDDDTLNNFMICDYNYCVSNIFIWLQTKSLKRKTEQTTHLLKLLLKILFDTKLMELFFKSETSSTEELFHKLCELPNLNGILEMRTVTIVLNYIIQAYQQSEMLITSFISRYKTEPIKLLLGYSEPVDKKLKNSNKNNWIKTELADQLFRTNYLKCKNSSVLNYNENKLTVSNNNISRDHVFKNPVPMHHVRDNVDLNNKSQIYPSETSDYFYISSKSQKFRSISSNDFPNNNNGKINDNSIGLTISGSLKSLVALDPSDTISISNIFDLNNLTTIEIDLAEMKKSKRMFSEVIIAGADDDRHKKGQLIPDIISSSTCFTNTLKISETLPPPLKEKKVKHKIK